MKVLRGNKLLPFAAATVVGLGTMYMASKRLLESRSNNDSVSVDLNKVQKNKILTRQEAICQSKAVIHKLQESTGSPGISVAVSLNGVIVWQQGFGYADVENEVKCTPHTVMKIASISKPITSVLLAKLWEMEVVDIDRDISDYVKYWPQKYWMGEKVAITGKQLATHRAGVRDYKPIKQERKSEFGSSDSLEFDYEEYYITETFKTIKESVSLFQNDPLISKPGDEFHYTTHGYTLLSACLEGASGKDFPTLAYNLYKDLGLTETYLDNDKQKLIYNRSCHYVRGHDGEIQNAPYAESSFKLAGAGMLSSVRDLIKFGNIVLYSFQRNGDMSQCIPGYLKSSTVQLLWQPIKGTEVSWHPAGSYGMGWQTVPCDKNSSLISESVTTDRKRNTVEKTEMTVRDPGKFIVGHTGGTVGASSVLMILPTSVNKSEVNPPCGIVVVILANLQGVSLGKVAVNIANIFDRCIPHDGNVQ